MMTQSLSYSRDVERHPSSRQPVNQTLNTLQIRGDYQAAIVPKGSPLSQRPGQAQSVRGRRDGWYSWCLEVVEAALVVVVVVVITKGEKDLSHSSFWCKHDFGTGQTKNEIKTDEGYLTFVL